MNVTADAIVTAILIPKGMGVLDSQTAKSSQTIFSVALHTSPPRNTDAPGGVFQTPPRAADQSCDADSGAPFFAGLQRVLYVFC